VNSSSEQLRERRLRAEAAFDWCLRNAERMELAGNDAHAAEWAVLASSTAVVAGHSWLVWQPLETLLARIGARLAPAREPAAARQHHRAGARPLRWLHVLTRSYVLGGHTAIARRWIERAPRAERHDLVLTYQDAHGVPANLARCIEQAGGSTVSLGGEASLLARARRLRDMAAQGADVVVLHAHPWDVVPALAFAVPGGPPVLLLNHSDHGFWVGAACADLVIDIRDSGLQLSRALRGVTRSALLPVPLPDPGRAPADRSAAQSRLADPAPLKSEIVLLTIGGSSKYTPFPGLSFGDVALAIVRAVPESTLMAVGPDPRSPFWRYLHATSGGRIIALGPDPDLAAWHAAADVYLEGFPRGSYTALLEVALAGRAFVRKPWLAPPEELPVDRGSLAAFDCPASPAAYVSEALALIRDSALREPMAQRARAAVMAAHCGAGWAAALESLVGQIPARHEPPGLGAQRPMPPGLQHYWDAYFRYLRGREDPFEAPAQRAAALGLEALPLPPLATPRDPGNPG
jgi:hypothetical protein